MSRARASNARATGEGRLFALVLGRVVKAERKRRGIDQRSFAAALGVSNSAVSRLESGLYAPDGLRLQLIADRLRLGTEQLDARVRFALEKTERLARHALSIDGAGPWSEVVERVLGVDVLGSMVEVGVALALRGME